MGKTGVTVNDLTRKVWEQSPDIKIPISILKVLIQRTFQQVVESVTAGDTVIVRGFGRVWPVHRHSYQGRNPRTGGPATIPERYRVKFKAAARWNAAMNKKG